jgi:branched-chain amino acid transport system permease protein
MMNEDLDLNDRGGLAVQINAVSRIAKRTVRERVPRPYRSGYTRTVSTLGTVLATLALLLAVYVLFRTAFFVVAPLLGVSVPSFQYTASSRILLFVVLALAWDLIGGQSGYSSFGNIAFFGIGAYVVGVLMNGTIGWLGTYSFAVAFLVAGGLSLVYALIVGFPILRLRGHYFAVATLGLLIATQQYVANLEQTGGGSGLTMPSPGFANIDRAFFLLFGALAVVTSIVYWYLTNARFGHGLRAIRSDEGKARTMGLNTTMYKTLAWGVSALFSGFAGAIFAYQNAFINPTLAFNVDWTVFMILMCLVGGIGRLWGAVLGAALLWEIRNILWSNGPLVQTASDLIGIPLNEVYLIVFGFLLIVFVLGAPEGILGYLESKGMFDMFRRRFEGTPVERMVGQPRGER